MLKTNWSSDLGVDKFMPFWIGDYLADTSRLSTLHHGAYFLLLLDYWRKGPPPDDDEILCAICKMEKKSFKKIKRFLLVFFTKKDGHLFQKRVEEELGLAKQRKDAAKIRAIKGAQARWGDKTDASSNASSNAPSNASSNAPSNASSNAPSNASSIDASMSQAMLEQCLGHATSSSSSSSSLTPTAAAAIQKMPAAADENLKNTEKIIERVVEMRCVQGKEKNKPVDDRKGLKNKLMNACEKNRGEIDAWINELKIFDEAQGKKKHNSDLKKEENRLYNARISEKLKEEETAKKKYTDDMEQIRSQYSKIKGDQSAKIMLDAVKLARQVYPGMPESAYQPDSSPVLEQIKKIMLRHGVWEKEKEMVGVKA